MPAASGACSTNVGGAVRTGALGPAPGVRLFGWELGTGVLGPTPGVRFFGRALGTGVLGPVGGAASLNPGLRVVR